VLINKGQKIVVDGNNMEVPYLAAVTKVKQLFHDNATEKLLAVTSSLPLSCLEMLLGGDAVKEQQDSSSDHTNPAILLPSHGHPHLVEVIQKQPHYTTTFNYDMTTFSRAKFVQGVEAAQSEDWQMRHQAFNLLVLVEIMSLLGPLFHALFQSLNSATPYLKGQILNNIQFGAHACAFKKEPPMLCKLTETSRNAGF
jgi:hypothetical protein